MIRELTKFRQMDCDLKSAYCVCRISRYFKAPWANNVSLKIIGSVKEMTLHEIKSQFCVA